MSRRAGERILDVELSEPLTGFDTAVEWLLAVALVLTPLAYGTTNAWSQQLLYVLVAVLAIVVGAKLTLVRGSRFVFTWAYAPMVLFLAMVTLSVIPLPAGVVRAISPGTWEEKTRLLSDIPTVHELLNRLTITFNVWNTERSLRMMLAVSVVFVAVVNTYRTPAQIKRLLLTIAGAGALVAALSLAQDVTHSDGEPYRIYWNLPLISVDAVHHNAGPFAGHAQLGMYLNLTIGAMLAYALVLVGENFNSEDPSLSEVIERMSETPMRIALLMILPIAMAIGAVVWSFARGPLLSLGLAMTVAALLVFYKRGWRGRETLTATCVLLFFAVAGGATYVLMDQHHDSAQAAFADSGAARIAIFNNMKPMYKTWPVMGSGLDSFEWVYPMFERGKADQSFYDHAEDDYTQTLSDTGVVGALLTAAFVAILFLHWRKAFTSRQPIQLATVGIALSLLAAMIHSTSDFSERTPAVALVTSVLLGLTVSLSQLAKPAMKTTETEPHFGWAPWPRVAGLALVLAAMGWSIWSLDGIRRAENISVESDPKYFSLDARPEDADYDARMLAYYGGNIADDAKAVTLDPQNVSYVQWLNHFRWRQLTYKLDPKSKAVMFPPDAPPRVKQIANELSAARVLCPCYGKLYSLIGKIQWDFLDKTEGAKNLNLAHTLRPGDAEPALYLCQAAAEQGKWDEAERWAQVCSSIDADYYDLLNNVLIRQYHRPDIAFRAMKDNMHALTYVAELVDRNSDKDLFQQIYQQQLMLAKEATRSAPKDSNVWSNLAGLLQANGQSADAIDALQTALNLDYGNIPWRMTLAHMLADIGRREDAARQVEICLRLQPQMDDAKTLLASLTNKPPRTDNP